MQQKTSKTEQDSKAH